VATVMLGKDPRPWRLQGSRQQWLLMMRHRSRVSNIDWPSSEIRKNFCLMAESGRVFTRYKNLINISS
jgi:hypothetical protein